MKKTRILTTTAIALAVLGSPLAAQEDAAALWDQHCAKCHGKDGSAGTKVGKKLKIRDYTDAEVQASFSDEVALKATLEGVTDEESGKQTMKGFADKLSEEQAKALVALIRTFDDAAEEAEEAE